MATTRIMALHAGTSAVETALSRSTDYIENGEKTNGGSLVLSYQCNPLTAPQEFTLGKREYALKTGRNQGERDVIGYHLRQSFKPTRAGPADEIDANTAGKVAWETVMSLTKGKHAFVVAVHVDKAHVHTHTVFNSTSLDCTRKFRNFKRSGLALQKISDMICLSHGLSIIETPQEKGKSYDKWAKVACQLGNNKPLGNREQLAFAIDSILPKCKTWEDFLEELKLLGCEIKIGANISIKLPEAKRFARLSSMPSGYDANSIRSRLSGEMKFEPKPLRETGAKVPQLLIDIQAKMQEGYGKGFEEWAKIENLKRSAKTLIYIQDSGIDSYDELERRCTEACGKARAIQHKIRAIEDKQNSINELQKQIGTYIKTRAIYKAYKDIKNPKVAGDFYESHRADITLHQAAKKYFDANNHTGKLPSINQLKEQWAELEKERRPLCGKYKEANKKFKDLCTAKSNSDRIIKVDKPREKSHDYGAGL